MSDSCVKLILGSGCEQTLQHFRFNRQLQKPTNFDVVKDFSISPSFKEKGREMENSNAQDAY